MPLGLFHLIHVWYMGNDHGIMLSVVLFGDYVFLDIIETGRVSVSILSAMKNVRQPQ